MLIIVIYEGASCRERMGEMEEEGRKAKIKGHAESVMFLYAPWKHQSSLYVLYWNAY